MGGVDDIGAVIGALDLARDRTGRGIERERLDVVRTDTVAKVVVATARRAERVVPRASRPGANAARDPPVPPEGFVVGVDGGDEEVVAHHLHAGGRRSRRREPGLGDGNGGVDPGQAAVAIGDVEGLGLGVDRDVARVRPDRDGLQLPPRRRREAQDPARLRREDVDRSVSAERGVVDVVGRGSRLEEDLSVVLVDEVEVVGVDAAAVIDVSALATRVGVGVGTHPHAGRDQRHVEDVDVAVVVHVRPLGGDRTSERVEQDQPDREARAAGRHPIHARPPAGSLPRQLGSERGWLAGSGHSLTGSRPRFKELVTGWRFLR